MYTEWEPEEGHVRVIAEAVQCDGGSIAIGTGRTEDGRYVQFAGDWRPMLVLADIIAANGEAECSVPRWAIL